MVRIPAGATSIYAQQRSNSGKLEDDNYLGEMGAPATGRNSCFLEHLVGTSLPALHTDRVQVSSISQKKLILKFTYLASPTYIDSQSIDVRVMFLHQSIVRDSLWILENRKAINQKF